MIPSRTLAQEEPDVTSVALRPGMVDTPVRSSQYLLIGTGKLTMSDDTEQMQELIRNRGPSTMDSELLKKFTDAHEKGELVKPEDAGHVIAALALKAPKTLSGQFVNWNGDECKEFRRR